MDFYLMVDSPEDFAAWTARRQADSTLDNFGFPTPAAAPVRRQRPGRRRARRWR